MERKDIKNKQVATNYLLIFLFFSHNSLLFPPMGFCVPIKLYVNGNIIKCISQDNVFILTKPIKNIGQYLYNMLNFFNITTFLRRNLWRPAPTFISQCDPYQEYDYA